MSEYILNHYSEMMKKEQKKITVYFITHGEVQNWTQSPNLKQRKILFTNESLTLRINVFVLLHGLKSIMKTNLWEKDIFSMKKLFEEIRLTHGESRRNSRGKHTLNKNINYIWLCLNMYASK